MKKIRFIISTLLIFAIALSTAGCGSSLLDPKKPVTLTLWHVYGEQADSPMNRLVNEFNITVGAEKGVIIKTVAMSNSGDIGRQLLDIQSGENINNREMPDLFFGHTSNAIELGVENLMDWTTCFSESELSAFVPDFLNEGMVDQRLSVLPVSKSTHLLFINERQFRRFSTATGITYDSLSSWDRFYSAAAAYYE